LPRKRDIEAAIAAHNDTDGPMQTLLPPEAARLLTAMFPRRNVCQRRLDDLAAEGFEKSAVTRLLRALIDAGFLSKDQSSGRIPTYHLHLLPQRQP
jgi:hypothetical protein